MGAQEFINYDQKIWDEVALQYEDYSYHGKDDRHPANLFRLKIILDFLKTQKPGKILDAGCGPGIASRETARLGWDCTAFDASPNMLEFSKNKAKEENLDIEFHQGNVTKMDFLPDNYFDVVMLNGVLPYLNQDEDKKVYKEVKRVLKKDGILIASHYNLFFDFFRFDRYTVGFLKNDLLADVIKGEELKEVTESYKTLLSKPYDPIGAKTMKSENPITFGSKLAEFGFKEMDRKYYNFYDLPPLLRDKSKNSRRKKLEIELNDKWQAIFLAKTFVSFASV